MIRHGQSYANAKNMIYGSLDYELTPEGRNQALWVKDDLLKVKHIVDKVYSSDLTRAKQTAMISMDLKKEQLNVDARFRERSFGRLEGVECHDLSLFEVNYLFSLLDSGKVLRDDIESSEELDKRLKNAFMNLDFNKNQVVFCHGGVLQHVLYSLNIRDLYLNNCGVIAVTVKNNGKPFDLYGYWNKFNSG